MNHELALGNSLFYKNLGTILSVGHSREISEKKGIYLVKM
jgi:hypothetical protein